MNQKNLTKDNINIFLSELSKGKSKKISNWLNTVFKKYVLLKKTLITNECFLSEVENIIEFLEKNFYDGIEDFSYEELLNISNLKFNAFYNLEEGYKLVEIKDSKYIDFLAKKHGLKSNYFERFIAIQNNSRDIVAFFSISTFFNSQRPFYDDFYTGTFYYDLFDRKALRIFYNLITEKYRNYKSYILDPSIFSVISKEPSSKKRMPISLWNDNEIIENLNIEESNISILPKNLTIKGDLYMSRSKLPILCEGLTVNGNIYAQNSQLVAIDDSVKLKEKIYSEDSLLTVFPEDFRQKIVDPKKFQNNIIEF